MDATTGKPDGTGSHIWLRYATQFNVGSRTITIEMGIPVPVGASSETRERLMREAEAGLEQLSHHVDGRVAQMLQHQQPTPNTTPVPKPLAPTVSKATSLRPPVANSPSPSPASAPLPISEEYQLQPSQNQEVKVPPTRPNIGASMPNAPGGDPNGSLKLPQFLQLIKENLGLDARQAMDLLKVKTLSGLNLRDALEQLQHLVQEPAHAPAPTQKTREESSAKPGEKMPLADASPITRPAPGPMSAAPSSSIISPIAKKAPIEELPHAVVRDEPPTYTFDEEINLDEDEEMQYPQELTNHERTIAEHVLSRLKDARGSSLASPARLTVLNNVMNSQISNEQLQELIQYVWGATTVKKLKNDQVEALISWAKEDDFVSEAELALALIEEELHAHSDR